MKIHQQNTNNFIDLSLPYKTTDSTGIIRNYTLVNGQGFNYRLEFTNRDTNAHYSEKLNLEPLTITDTVFLKTTDNGGNIIDLQQQSFIDNNSNTMKLSIYPNPTDKLIYATAYLPVSAYVNSDTKVCSQLVIKIYSNLGTELYKQEVKAGETLQIPTDKLTNGVYFIRAEQKATMDNTLSPAIQSFIIQR